MQLVFKREWDFMGRRRFFIALSLALIVLSLLSLSMRGLNFGIDFTGGALIEVGYPEAADLGAMRDVLGSAGFEDAQVQNFGTSRDALIRLRPNEELDGATLGETVMNVLSAADPDVSLRRVEFVGPQVGEDLREQGGLAMLFALLLILAYVA
ncbi:MAG: protein translocase subunit SecF, partial [Chromatiales bacterium]|nr:protein translocase subunit SecF [Chromatiales bacterium]